MIGIYPHSTQSEKRWNSMKEVSAVLTVIATVVGAMIKICDTLGDWLVWKILL